MVEAYGTLAHAVRLMLLVIFAAQVCLTVAGFEASGVLCRTGLKLRMPQQRARVLAFLGWATQTVISRRFFALGSTWLPTAVGTAVALCAVPLYVLLRQQKGAIGLAVSSAIAILVCVCAHRMIATSCHD
jgi:putative peptidoglycan lipid II flippase